MTKFAKVGTGRKISLILSAVNLVVMAGYGLTLIALQYTGPFLWAAWGISEFASGINVLEWALREPKAESTTTTAAKAA